MNKKYLCAWGVGLFFCTAIGAGAVGTPQVAGQVAGTASAGAASNVVARASSAPTNPLSGLIAAVAQIFTPPASSARVPGSAAAVAVTAFSLSPTASVASLSPSSAAQPQAMAVASSSVAASVAAPSAGGAGGAGSAGGSATASGAGSPGGAAAPVKASSPAAPISSNVAAAGAGSAGNPGGATAAAGGGAAASSAGTAAGASAPSAGESSAKPDTWAQMWYKMGLALSVLEACPDYTYDQSRRLFTAKPDSFTASQSYFGIEPRSSEKSPRYVPLGEF